MKKMMILFSALVMALSSFAENQNLKPFSGVNVNVPARVRFVYGDRYEMEVQCADSLATSALRWSVKDDVLNIRSLDSENTADLCITIMCPVEPTLTVGRNVELKAEKRKKAKSELAENN